MDIRQPVTNCATALSSYIQGSLLFSFAFAFGVSLWRPFSLISFSVQTTDEKNPSSWHLSWPPFPSDHRHKASPKLMSLTGSTAGKSAEPWTSYLRYDLQISGPGLQRLNSRRPQRKKPINLSQFNGSSDLGFVATIQGHTGTSGFCPEAWCLKFFAFVSEIISQVHIFISFFLLKALGSQQGRLFKIPGFESHDLSLNQFLSIMTSRLQYLP